MMTQNKHAASPQNPIGVKICDKKMNGKGCQIPDAPFEAGVCRPWGRRNQDLARREEIGSPYWI